MPCLIVILALLSIATSAHAASFDCTKPLRQDERTICHTMRLNDRDVRMGTLYALDLRFVPMGGREILRRDQAKWLESRRFCRANIACLSPAYEGRMADLRQIIDMRVYPHGPF
ncbi:hypothetical protein SAMN05444678_101163 [Sphingomonas sp. YR710]|uniref:lysozyme inhibitor LprI family protein n=1 Tax=Sphingomonas sp. YR710 TaxID=1882773 RepID=UPI0008810BC3|nr:hypothetical protein [Sphingomonas sp. YR710]SDC02827.1 hypothetical protein SAMN05444678_101163 [Sphingomonas sp. YR710]